MGLHPGQPDYARHGHGACRGYDQRKPPSRLRCVAGDTCCLIAACFVALSLLSATAQAESIRIASYQTELARDGPGLMLRDILRQEVQAVAVARTIAHVRPDILVLQGVDYDHAGQSLRALQALIAREGVAYSYHFARRPNSGLTTGLDMNGDRRFGGPRDGQGFGRFAGNRGMAILSKWPIDEGGARDMSALLWKDMPGADLPRWPDGRPFPSLEAQKIQRLSSVAHWQVPITVPSGERLHILAFHATPPVFDGVEDQNGLRNAAEIRFWQLFLDGVFGLAPKERFVIAGIANIDPDYGTGRQEAIRDLLSDPRIQDPKPTSPKHGTKTVDWPDPDPGDMRASYVLPSVDMHVIAAGVFWPDTEASDHVAASRHRIVWVDLDI